MKNYFGTDKLYWSLDSNKVVEDFATRLSGLNSQEVEKRLNDFGKNIFKNKDKKSSFSIFLKQFASPLIFILIAAFILTFILNEWIEVIVIGLAIGVNIGLGFYREYHAENTIEKLSNFIKDKARVVRDGIEQEIDSEFVVPGDILKISYGNRIPADARILDLNNLKIDEAVLTGESLPVEKNKESIPIGSSIAERKNMVHAGTLVVEGFATVIVVETGNKTQIGLIASLVSKTSRAETPIQKGISKIAWVIFGVVIFIVIGIFILGISRGQSSIDMLILAAAVSVGAVPESLPIALTVILSIGAERIANKKGITRNLVAAETLGSTSLIMTDKTGTLTEANMKLIGSYRISEILQDKIVTGLESEDISILKFALQNVDVLVENQQDNEKNWTFKGKPFEVNIVKTAQSLGLDIKHLINRDISKISIPFNSTHKFSVSNNNESSVIMGAPDVLLNLSKMTLENYQKIENWILKASSEGQRLIAIASINNKNISKIEDVSEIVLEGILAFNDPLRKGVAKSIKDIENSGVRVVMITGDLKGTAISVAKDLGWEVNDSNVITGKELKELTDQDLLKLLPTLKLFTRVTPEDKLRVGNLYRSLGEVVAMTGDGVNDAPALKAMDIGIAVGSGSDVAKSASDLVLLNDSFETISSAIIEGRRILSNIRKTFVYLMSNSLDEVFVIGGSLIVGIALPINALQIIWVNLFTGSLPALAFAYDEDFDHKRSNKDTNRSLFTKPLTFLTFGVGTVSSFLLFLMYYIFIKLGVEIGVARSVFFVCFASYILAVAYSFRSLHKPLFSYSIFSNRKLNISILIAFSILIITMLSPFMRKLFELAPLPKVWLIFVLGWILLNVLLVEGAKYLFRRPKFIR